MIRTLRVTLINFGLFLIDWQFPRDQHIKKPKKTLNLQRKHTEKILQHANGHLFLRVMHASPAEGRADDAHKRPSASDLAHGVGKKWSVGWDNFSGSRKDMSARSMT